MKTAWTAWVLAASSMGVSFAGEREPDIVVCLHRGTEVIPVLARAENQAQRMFGHVGITVAWREGTPKNHGTAEVIEAVLRERTAPDFKPGDLAFATLGVKSGTRIEIFYDRVLASARPGEASSILAHVLVHEITHILEGVARHSESGIMKANWEPEDFRKMRQSLQFAKPDIRLIQAWTERHRGMLTASLR